MEASQSKPLDGENTLDTVTRARQERKEQGPWEVEVSYGGETDLHRHLNECDKNPGHLKFIPVDKFDVDKLPKDCRDNDLVDLIRAMSDLTVRVAVKYVSNDRPETFPGTDKPYPCYKNRGRNMMRVGTGWVGKIEIFPKVYQTSYTNCTCKECLNSLTQTSQFAHIYINTAAHVVFDGLEGEQTTCHLFFDRGGSPTACSGVVKLTGMSNVFTDANNDISIMRYMTHDLVLAGRLYKMLYDCHRLHFVVNTNFNTPFPDENRSPLHAGEDIETSPLQAGIDIVKSAPEARTDIEKSTPEARTDIEKSAPEARTDIEKSTPEARTDIEKSTPEDRTDIEKSTPEARTNLDKSTPEARTDIEKSTPEARTNLDKSTPEARTDIEKSTPEARTNLDKSTPEARTDIEKSTPEARTDIEKSTSEARTDLEESTSEARTDKEMSTPEARTDKEKSTSEARTDKEKSTPEARTDIDKSTPEARTDLHKSTPEARTDIDKSTPEARTDLHKSTPVYRTDIEKSTPEARTEIEKSTPEARTDDIDESTPEARTEIEKSTPETRTDVERTLPEVGTDLERSLPQASSVVDSRHKLTIIVSHPHGCSKHVSIGQCIALDEREGGWAQHKYTTPTCAGSSGAHVYVLGSNWGVWWTFGRVHGGNCTDNSELNYSALGLETP